jgi:hypothetical protein
LPSFTVRMFSAMWFAFSGIPANRLSAVSFSP